MRGLTDKVCLIAGGAPGNIGGATARRLVDEGAIVVVGDLNVTGAEKVAAELRELGGRAVGTALDMTDEGSVQAFVDTAVREYGTVHGLFNVAADLSPATIGVDTHSTALDIPLDVWHHTLDVTLTGYLHAIRRVLPIMIDQGSGSIVNTMSAAVWMAEPVRVSYAAAKAGVEAMTRHVATIAGKQGVRSNAIAPGTVRTASNVANMSDDEVARQTAAVRSPRLGRPEDVAAAVAFLLSDDSSWINAQTILVDGGAIIR